LLIKSLELRLLIRFNRIMTKDDKTLLFRFLDLTDDYLRDGVKKAPRGYVFTDDNAVQNQAPQSPAAVDSLGAVAAEILVCSSCALSGGRTQAVPGEGVSSPLVLVVGEGPGADEDASGRPFVGKAGQLLDRMLAAVGLSREKNCFIANTVKCRPPGNRDPLPEETAACAPFLGRQLALLKPLVVLAAGRVAAQTLLGTSDPIGKLRGRFIEYKIAASGETIPLLPTYHPSALLRDESLKRPAFEDLKLLMVELLSLNSAYAREVQPLLAGYAQKDEAFAARVKEYLQEAKLHE
jgi:DNA polymerase